MNNITIYFADGQIRDLKFQQMQIAPELLIVKDDEGNDSVFVIRALKYWYVQPSRLRQ